MSHRDFPLVLLGAGASVPAGIPTATEMTERMLQSGASSDEKLPSLKSHHRRVIRFVAGGIAMHRGEQGDNPLSGINIEELFTAVKMLADRDTLEIAPFVAQWHNAVEVIDDTVRSDSSLNEWSLEVAIRETLEVAIRAANDEYEIDSFIWDDSKGIESNLGMAANELRRKIDEYLSGGNADGQKAPLRIPSTR